ncbi:P-selectin glycoprotein ligand 1 [Carlito syrichta]|uniref:P-selectin glycoprotein ligand 1 n=1 Tax=Carlito syrichta TaxID=1868482 RepID=A0A1U7TTE0_CARSF|nr:P-selectin glycoprotein ligand 1 [Carlito syrichta]
MPLQLLVLLALLGPGSNLPLWDTRVDGAGKTPGPLLSRGRRQDIEEEDMDDDYVAVETDPPEVLGTHNGSELVTMAGTLGQTGSVVPGAPELTTVEAATGDSAGLDTGGSVTGNLSMELATQGAPDTTAELVTELATESASITEDSSNKGILSTELATTEALSMEPAVLKAQITQPTATEALPMEPTATEAPTVESTATEAQTGESTATEDPVQPTVKEALSTEPPATETPLTVAPFTEPATEKTQSTAPAPTRGLTTVLLVPSVAHNSTPVGALSLSNTIHVRSGPSSSPGSPVAPSSVGAPDHIPVKQCLLAILILALVATIFLVCTVVLAVRLSRKSHTYPVRSYSPTEMVCISALLPDGGEGPPTTANGGLPKTKGPGPTPEPREREGDDLTLQSFLP